MQPVVLPPKYYRDHFFEFLDFLETHYGAVLESVHFNFIRDFRQLPDEAQCLFVRMINRKGQVFRTKDFLKYDEIKNSDLALVALLKAGFVEPLNENHKALLIQTLTKAELRKWLSLAGLKTPASLSREDLELAVEQNLDSISLSQLPQSEGLILQGKLDPLEYLLFLYFGKIQTSLSLYTLRDLGIRRASDFKAQFKARFNTQAEARQEYGLARRLFSLQQEGQWQPDEWMRHCASLENLTTSAENLKNNLLLSMALQLEQLDADLALKALEKCSMHPARERVVRLLYRLEQKEKARKRLEEMLISPWSEEELLFTEDFLNRKFGSKKVGRLSELLREAPEILLSDSYYKKPERGVRDHFRTMGYRAFFSENYLWNTLFGLLFWRELFEGESAAIFNPFERSPADLMGQDFYQKNKSAIEVKLAKLNQGKIIELEILKVVSSNMGKLNDIFQWKPKMIEQVLEFLRSSKSQDVALILRTMAQKYLTFHSGFPDLLIIKDDVASFVEVKAEGDALRASQLAKIQVLMQAGFKVEILKVKWQADPNQVYVVVDVETTGGAAVSHKITEIGAVKIQNGKVIDEFQTLLNPGRPIPRFITQLTGISNQMVENAPKFSDIAETFNQFTKGALFVAHNARFDYGFIQREFERIDQTFVRPILCTVSGMRKAYPGLPSYSLKNLVDHFGLRLDSHHRALSDARAAADLLLMINDKRPQVADTL